MEYSITKDHCNKMINDNHICDCCGGKIEPIETVDNSGQPTFWAGCNECNRFTSGVTQDVYDIAVKMVQERHLRPYTYMEEPSKENKESYDYWFKSQVSGSTRIVRDVIFYHNNK